MTCKSFNKADIRGYIKTCVRLGKDLKKISKNCVMCMKTSVCHSDKFTGGSANSKNVQTDLYGKQRP